MELKSLNVKRFTTFAKKNAVLLAAAGLGILLLLLGSISGKDASTSEPKLLDESEYNEMYVSSLEERLENVLSQMDGVGRVSVMVTLENGVEYVYATESRSTSDVEADAASRQSRESSLTIIDTDDGRATVPIKRIEPTVKGVAVICDGGGEAKTKSAVNGTVCSLLGLTSNRVSVNKMS